MHPSARSLGLNVVRSAGNEEYLLCPFHSDTKPSASYNRRKGMFFCYVCQIGLNVEQLSKRLGVEIELEEEDRGREPLDYNLIVEKVELELGVPFSHPYFQERGISEETIARYEVRWSAITSSPLPS